MTQTRDYYSLRELGGEGERCMYVCMNREKPEGPSHKKNASSLVVWRGGGADFWGNNEDQDCENGIPRVV